MFSPTQASQAAQVPQAPRKSLGFTLAGTVVTIALTSALAAIAVPAYHNQAHKAVRTAPPRDSVAAEPCASSSSRR